MDGPPPSLILALFNYIIKNKQKQIKKTKKMKNFFATTD